MAQAETTPVGRDEVMAALKRATLELLVGQGTQFSVRDVAKRAGVNHGLVHRHFDSKAELISAAVADLAADLELRIRQGASPLDLVGAAQSPTSHILGRLILEDQAHLVRDHPAVAALVEQAKRQPSASAVPPEARAALATALSLGWSVFGQFALSAAGTDLSAELEAELRAIIENLVGAAHAPSGTGQLTPAGKTTGTERGPRT